MRSTATCTLFCVLAAVGSTVGAAEPGSILFSDDFSRLDPAWGSAGELLRAENGKLVLQLAAGAGKTLLHQTASFTDADIRMSITAERGDQYIGSGVAFWVKTNADLYVAVAEANGIFGVSRFVDGKARDVVKWKENPAVKKGAGQANALRIVTRGPRVTIYVNDRVVASFRGDPPAGGGRIGVYAEAGDQPCRFEFAELKVLQPPAGGEGSLIFSDDFATLAPNWGPADERHHVENHKFVLQPEADSGYHLLYQGCTFDDADIRAQVTLNRGTDCPTGIVFWGSDYLNYYVAKIDTGGSFTVKRFVNNRLLAATPWQKTDAIKPGVGATNELRVVTQGNQATFYVNGRQVGAIRGYPPAIGGLVGFYAESSKEPNAWHFSDLKVLETAPETAAIAADENAPIFADDFSSFDPAYTGSRELFDVAGGKLVCRPPADAGASTLYQGAFFDDADIRVNVALSEGDPNQAACVLFWARDLGDMYVAEITPSGVFSVHRRTRDRWLPVCPGQTTDAIKQGPKQVNALRVVTRGNQAAFFINGRQVAQIRGFPQPDGNLVGLRGESGTAASTWQFSDFQVLKAPPSAQTPSAEPGLLLADDFSSLDPAWGLAGDRLSVAKGKLVCTPLVNTAYTALYQGAFFDDVDIRVNVRTSAWKGPQPAGIVFWARDVNSLYVAQVSEAGNFSIYRHLQGQWLPVCPPQPSDAVRAGLEQTNELRVVTQGNRATFYVNGRQVTTIRGFPEPGGNLVGLQCESGSRGYSAWRYSDFKILSAPAGAPTPNEPGVLLSERFETLDPAWGPGDERLRVADDHLIFSPPFQGVPTALYRGNLFGDADIRLNVTQDRGGADREGGVVFWATDDANYYLAGFQPDGTYGICRVMNNRWLFPTGIRRKSDAVRQGAAQTNALRVVTRGNQATFSINDREVASLRGYPPAGGGLLGVYADSPASADTPSSWRFSELKVVQPAPASPPAGAPAGAPGESDVVVADDFATLDPAWLSLGEQPLSVADHKLVCRPSVEAPTILLHQATMFNDADIRVTLTQSQGEADRPGGIVFWGSRPANDYYLAEIDRSGRFSVLRALNRELSAPVAWTASNAIKTGLGEANELRVVTRGNRASFFINGKLAARCEGVPPEGGSVVGLAAHSGTQPYTWQFGSFSVRNAPPETAEEKAWTNQPSITSTPAPQAAPTPTVPGPTMTPEPAPNTPEAAPNTPEAVARAWLKSDAGRPGRTFKLVWQRTIDLIDAVGLDYGETLTLPPCEAGDYLAVAHADDRQGLALEFSNRTAAIRPAEPDETYTPFISLNEWAQAKLSLYATAYEVKLSVRAPKQGARVQLYVYQAVNPGQN